MVKSQSIFASNRHRPCYFCCNSLSCFFFDNCYSGKVLLYSLPLLYTVSSCTFFHSIKNYNKPKSFPFQLYNSKLTGVKLFFQNHEESLRLTHTEDTDLEGWDGAQNESSRGDDHKSYWYHSDHLKHCSDQLRQERTRGGFMRGYRECVVCRHQTNIASDASCFTYHPSAAAKYFHAFILLQ